MAVLISEEKLLEYASRLNDQTVLIIGSSSSNSNDNIGKVFELAQAFAERGANVVIGDEDEELSNRSISGVARIREFSNESLYQKCDASQWDDQVQLFESTQAKFGSIDVVVINLLNSKDEGLETVDVGKELHNLPSQPNMKTLEKSLCGVIYSMHLAIHYLQKSTAPNSLKAAVILGSTRAFDNLSGAALLAAANSAAFGVMASIQHQYSAYGLRVSMVADSIDAEAQDKTKLSGTSQSRISDAIVFAASDKASNGAVYSLQNRHQITYLPASLFNLKEGVSGALLSRFGL